MSDINEIRMLSSSYVIWLIILPIISSFCYQFDGIFIGTSQTKELRNAMIFFSINLFVNIDNVNKVSFKYWYFGFLFASL